MDHNEILRHCHEECRRFLIAQGNDVPEHEADEGAARLVPLTLAIWLSHAMVCAELASPYFDQRFKERAERQLWNWG